MPSPIIDSSAPATATPTTTTVVEAETNHPDGVAPLPNVAIQSIAPTSKLQHLQKSRAFIKATKTRCRRRVAAWVRYHLERKNKIVKPNASTSSPNVVPSHTPSRNEELPAAAALAARALLSMGRDERLPAVMDVRDDASLLDMADLAWPSCICVPCQRAQSTARRAVSIAEWIADTSIDEWIAEWVTASIATSIATSKAASIAEWMNFNYILE
mmetsp:Transcript_4515/g.10218  ORF Transcript_4515/g.10218 Transcript_4515/m.10218 type:complete len:214 (+) Transcript_4515:113-754(+)